MKRILQQTLRLGLIAAICLPLTACLGPNIKGYKTKPYSIRGIRYHPMQPGDAIGHRETGIASHYSEHFLIFPGKTATGEKLWPWTKVAAHKTLPITSVQFHPESIASEWGHRILRNFLVSTGFNAKPEPSFKVGVVKAAS